MGRKIAGYALLPMVLLLPAVIVKHTMEGLALLLLTLFRAAPSQVGAWAPFLDAGFLGLGLVAGGYCAWRYVRWLGQSKNPPALDA